MSYAAYPPGISAADPGRAVPLRLLAWVVDLVLYLGVALVTFLPLAERTDTSGFGRALTTEPFGGLNPSFCSRLRESRALSECFQFGDTAWYTTGARTLVHSLVGIGWFVGIHVVLQGLTGGSLGKLVVGVRVVQADGAPPGVGRALVRSLLWVVDGLPCCVPLVGLVTLLATGRKQRVGDLAAKTFVVKVSERGIPVMGSSSSSGAYGPGPSPPVPSSPPGFGYPPAPGYPPPPAPGYRPPGYPPPPG